jgi:hypothetical protein
MEVTQLFAPRPRESPHDGKVVCPICGTPSLYRTERRLTPPTVVESERRRLYDAGTTETIFVCYRCRMSFEPNAWGLDESTRSRRIHLPSDYGPSR